MVLRVKKQECSKLTLHWGEKQETVPFALRLPCLHKPSSFAAQWKGDTDRWAVDDRVTACAARAVTSHSQP